jgi:hypothetical protein
MIIFHDNGVLTGEGAFLTLTDFEHVRLALGALS